MATFYTGSPPRRSFAPEISHKKCWKCAERIDAFARLQIVRPASPRRLSFRARVLTAGRLGGLKWRSHYRAAATLVASCWLGDKVACVRLEALRSHALSKFKFVRRSVVVVIIILSPFFFLQSFPHSREKHARALPTPTILPPVCMICCQIKCNSKAPSWQMTRLPQVCSQIYSTEQDKIKLVLLNAF